MFGTMIGTGFTILAMIKGWGLEPVSWPWIIGAGTLGLVFAKLIAYTRH